MIFYGQERLKGFTPRAGKRDRAKKWRLRPGRVISAVILVAILVAVYFVLAHRGYLVVAEAVRTIGELTTGALIGVFLAEGQSVKIINIYVGDHGGEGGTRE